MFVIEMQYFPQSDLVWVQKLLPSDLGFIFETYEEAQEKLTELQEKDISGRQYRIAQISI